jgi:hypothetical protein
MSLNPICEICGNEIKPEEAVMREGKVYCSVKCLTEAQALSEFRAYYATRQTPLRKIIVILLVGIALFFFVMVFSYCFPVKTIIVNLSFLTLTLAMYITFTIKEIYSEKVFQFFVEKSFILAFSLTIGVLTVLNFYSNIYCAINGSCVLDELPGSMTQPPSLLLYIGLTIIGLIIQSLTPYFTRRRLLEEERIEYE